MADPIRSDKLTHAVIFTALGVALLLVQILPLGVAPGQLPGPDILLLLVFSWVLWRPDYVPVWLIALIVLLADFLLMRPPGLRAALTVIGAEYLRARSIGMRDSTFVFDWLLVAGVTAFVFVGNHLLLALFVVDRPPLGLILVQLLATVAVYPLVVILGGRAFGLRRLAPGEVDGLGHRQ